MESLMEKENTAGKMEVLMRASLKMEWNMGKEDGLKVSLQRSAFMKEDMFMIRRVVRENLSGPLEILMKVNMRMMNETVLEWWNGQTGLFIQEIGSMESSMEEERWISQTGLLKRDFLRTMYS